MPLRTVRPTPTFLYKLASANVLTHLDRAEANHYGVGRHRRSGRHRTAGDEEYADQGRRDERHPAPYTRDRRITWAASYNRFAT